MKTFCIDTFILLLESVADIILIRGILHQKPKKLSLTAPVLLLLSTIGSLFLQFLPGLLGWLLLLVASLFCYKFVFSASFENIFTAYAIQYILISFIENIIVLAMPKTTDSLNDQIVQFTGLTAMLILAMLFARFLPLNRLFVLITDSALSVRLLLSDLFFFVMLSVALPKQLDIRGLQLVPLLMVFTLLLLISNILMIRQQQTILTQQANLNAYRTYQPMMNDLIFDLQNKQHDINNQINAIKMLPLTHKTYDSLSAALTDYTSYISREFREYELLKINMPVVAGFVFTKLMQAKKQSKQLEVTVKNYSLQSRMPEYELIRVLGILLDNALEAVAENSSVELRIDSRDNRIIFVTRNTGPYITDELKTKMFTRGFTTKNKIDGRNHGYGLNSLLELLDTYEGKLFLENSSSGGTNLVCFEVIV